MKNRRRPRSITDRGEEERDEGTDDDLLNGRTQPTATEAGRNHHIFRTVVGAPCLLFAAR